jgi:hypothetical protein
MVEPTSNPGDYDQNEQSGYHAAHVDDSASRDERGNLIAADNFSKVKMVPWSLEKRSRRQEEARRAGKTMPPESEQVDMVPIEDPKQVETLKQQRIAAVAQQERDRFFDALTRTREDNPFYEDSGREAIW